KGIGDKIAVNQVRAVNSVLPVQTRNRSWSAPCRIAKTSIVPAGKRVQAFLLTMRAVYSWPRGQSFLTCLAAPQRWDHRVSLLPLRRHRSNRFTLANAFSMTKQ